MPTPLPTAELLSTPEQTDWLLYRASTPRGWQLYALRKNPDIQPDALHLGVFDDPGNLAVQKVRFLEDPKTCVGLPYAATLIRAWLDAPEAIEAPRFCGYFGSHWSGYRIEMVDASQVQVIYTADLRQELLGVFTDASAFTEIQLHYDRRRQRCLIC